MKNLSQRIAIAAALTMALYAALASAQEAGPSKLSCASADRSTLLEATLRLDTPKPRLTNLMVVSHGSVYRPTVDAKTISEFFYDSTLILIRGDFAGGKLDFSVQPSVSEAGAWSGPVVTPNSKTATLSCDLQ
ncbi:MAG TPA: hypothetical protein VM901_07265 [Bdellovibrionota bacterium]|jgi:hypothetical protein|nr:hypothetical protein [Bdellovibrionota bacterium]